MTPIFKFLFVSNYLRPLRPYKNRMSGGEVEGPRKIANYRGDLPALWDGMGRQGKKGRKP